jgi:hypothetical protein
MAMSRAGQEGLTNYTPEEKTMGYAVKERVKAAFKPDKGSLVDKIETRKEAVEKESRKD